jgi:hypothetical protein
MLSRNVVRSNDCLYDLFGGLVVCQDKVVLRIVNTGQ